MPWQTPGKCTAAWTVVTAMWEGRGDSEKNNISVCFGEVAFGPCHGRSSGPSFGRSSGVPYDECENQVQHRKLVIPCCGFGASTLRHHWFNAMILMIQC